MKDEETRLDQADPAVAGLGIAILLNTDHPAERRCRCDDKSPQCS
jgi:hypothetical protein